MLKKYYNFQIYQIMLNILGFFFMYDKLQLFLYVMDITPHLHVLINF